MAVITGGEDGMPAFGDKLTADEIVAIVAFLREKQAGS